LNHLWIVQYKEKRVAKEEQIETMIIPAIKNISQQWAGYGEKLQCPLVSLL
tara:strand:- start:243 stop:395 length:153 start_codon:yes stop_codon:yes gene_type:complete